MSGAAIVHCLLKTNTALTNVVPASRIKNGDISLGTQKTAISVQKISSVQRNHVGMNSQNYLVRERVQVTVATKHGEPPVDILALVRAALPAAPGYVNGFACQSILPDTEGPETEDMQTLIDYCSQDFMVSFTR